MLWPFVRKGYSTGALSHEVWSSVPTTVHQAVQKRDGAAPSCSFLVLCTAPGKPLEDEISRFSLCPRLIKVGLHGTCPVLKTSKAGR